MFTLVLRCLATISVVTSLMVGYDFIADPKDTDSGKITKMEVHKYEGKTSFKVTVIGRKRYLKNFEKQHYDLLEIGDDVELKLGRFIGEWVHVNISRNGKSVLSIPNFEGLAMLGLSFMFFAAIVAFLPEKRLYKDKRRVLPIVVLSMGGISILLLVTHVLV